MSYTSTYTEEMVAYILSVYKPKDSAERRNLQISFLANYFGRSALSVKGKLAVLGIYVPRKPMHTMQDTDKRSVIIALRKMADSLDYE